MMEPGASKSAKEQLKMEMTIKTEVEAAATSTAHIDIKTDLNHLKQELVMVQSLNCEPALSVKEEILEDGCQGGNDQQCVQGTSTPAGTGSLNEACSLRDRLYKNELEELNIGPTVSRHMDIHYPIKKLNAHDAVTEESTTLDDCSEEMPCRGVKKESLEEKLRDGNEQQCVEGTITPADSGSRHEACGTSLGGFLHVKQDLDDMDIGPTVLQHMDIYNIINKNWSAIKEENTIVHDCNEVMPHHGVKKETAEDKLIDNQIKAYKGQTTTVVEYEVELTSCLSQQKELQQNILRQHQASSSNGFKCDSCNRIFHKPHLLSAHKKLHAHKEKPYQCTTCNARFAQRCALNGHMRVHTGQKPYQCTTCDARFAKNGHLTRHMRVHTGEKPYKCTTCDARFADSGTLTGHMRVHTGEKTYQCTTCDARFADSGALTKHTRVHSGEKPYQCTTCDARFAKKSSLSRHMRVHTGEKPYQCTTCDARFAQTSALTRHMRVHTGEKPYQCTTCDARFADSGTLIGHKRVHTGEKPYQCTTCDARFANSGALTKHSRVHTGEKP